MERSDFDQEGWSPGFCPNPDCRFHRHQGGSWPYRKNGYFRRQQRPYRIQRYTCLCCKRSFSSQTFSTTYWQKLPRLDGEIFMKTVGGMANRQIARDLGHSPETINRHLARLGRHCLLYHQQLRQRSRPAQEVVVDGFESFELSQYYPFHHHVAVEKGTDFFIFFTDSELRRKGRMTQEQHERRRLLEAQWGRPNPRAIAQDMQQVLQEVFAGVQGGVLYSDDHHAYRKSLRQSGLQLQHRVTSGREHRDRSNSLWEINLLDLLIRHSSANHKRQTLAWSKRRQSSAERLAILLVWRNYIKRRREKQGSGPTPAMQRGMLAAPLGIGQLVSERLFCTRIPLPERWQQYYDRTVKTRALPRQRRHDLKLAY